MKLRAIVLASSACIIVACSPSQTQQLSAPPARVQPIVVRPNLPSIATPSIKAKSAIVIDTLTGRILFQKNARTPRAVASTQKLLTALCVYRAGPLSDPVTVRSTDTKVEPTKIYVSTGENYTRQTLVKALLVKSGNDVARVLARDVSGSQSAFVNYMNQTARSLGMTQSNFKNPHGLTEKGQYSTALDIAILAREITKIPFYRQCMRTKEYTFTFPDGRTKVLKNTNKILKRVPYCTGMKTGYTSAAGRCLVSSGVLRGKAVIVVTLGSTSPEIWNDSAKLLKWALE